MRRLNIAMLQPLPRDANARPRIERPQLCTAVGGGPLIFVDEIGGRWEVFDLVGDVGAEPHQCTRAETPSRRAQYRVFLYRDGLMRVHSFARYERRDLTRWREARLQSQLERGRRLLLPDGFAFPPPPWERRVNH